MSFLLYKGVESTGSRGAIIAIAAVIGIIVIFKVIPVKCVVPVLVFLALGGLVGSPLAGSLMDESALGRVDAWGDANYAFKAHLPFGVGLGMSTEYTGRAIHNAFVECYMELGVFGYACWFSLIVVAIMGAVQTRRRLSLCERSRELGWLYRFSMYGTAAMCGFAASSFFLTRAFAFPLFFLMGMLGCVPYLAEDLLDEPQTLSVTNRDAVIVGGLSAFLSIIYIYVVVILLNLQR
jgi:putative inorganic carbon (hco3(-)) transporter